MLENQSIINQIKWTYQIDDEAFFEARKKQLLLKKLWYEANLRYSKIFFNYFCELFIKNFAQWLC